MGRYATSTSISILLPNWLISNTTTSDAYGRDIWSAAADRAEGEVDATLVNKYDPQPWTSTGTPAIPPLVRKLSEDLACLYAVRAAITQDSQLKNPNLAAWENAREVLNEIRDGKVKLAYTDGSLVPTRSSSKFLTSTNYTQIFNLDTETAWLLDPNESDDIATERT